MCRRLFILKLFIVLPNVARVAQSGILLLSFPILGTDSSDPMAIGSTLTWLVWRLQTPEWTFTHLVVCPSCQKKSTPIGMLLKFL